MNRYLYEWTDQQYSGADVSTVKISEHIYLHLEKNRYDKTWKLIISNFLLQVPYNGKYEKKLKAENLPGAKKESLLLVKKILDDAQLNIDNLFMKDACK